jgi:TIR domain
MPESSYDVFISHSSKNADLGTLMKQYLATRGIRCWKAPDDIEPSEPWPVAIMRGLRECPIVVLIWTKESMASDQVLKEDHDRRSENQGDHSLPGRGDPAGWWAGVFPGGQTVAGSPPQL